MTTMTPIVDGTPEAAAMVEKFCDAYFGGWDGAPDATKSPGRNLIREAFLKTGLILPAPKPSAGLVIAERLIFGDAIFWWKSSEGVACPLTLRGSNLTEVRADLASAIDAAIKSAEDALKAKYDAAIRAELNDRNFANCWQNSVVDAIRARVEAQ